MGSVYTPFFVLYSPGLTFFVVMSKKNLNTILVKTMLDVVYVRFFLDILNKECC
jgi:hypothetical protein